MTYATRGFNPLPQKYGFAKALLYLTFNYTAKKNHFCLTIVTNCQVFFYISRLSEDFDIFQQAT